jgi:DUF1365 family protein
MPARPVLFLGHVMHRRLRPVTNAFIYPVFYMQLPVADLDAARCSIFSVDGSNLLGFHRKDHGPRDGSPLLPWIQAQLRERGLPDDGEIVLQCFPRVLGYVFNPVSFWFCRNGAGDLIAVLAEVRNTFGGCHNYLLHNPDGTPLRDGQVLTAGKAFHVSPFCEVEGSYRFRFLLDRDRPVANIDYDDGEGEGDLLLTAISGRAREWSSSALLSAFLRMPFLTAGVMLRIHWQALKLWLKGVPFHGKSVPQSFQESTK